MALRDPGDAPSAPVFISGDGSAYAQDSQYANVTIRVSAPSFAGDVTVIGPGRHWSVRDSLLGTVTDSSRIILSGACISFTNHYFSFASGYNANVSLSIGRARLHQFVDRQGDAQLSSPVEVSRPSGVWRACADGANASLVTLRLPDIPNIDNARLRIKEDPAGSLQSTYGSFSGRTVYASDSVGFRYLHPTNPPAAAESLLITFEAYDAQTGVTIADQPVGIFRPPVLLVHGLWSNPATFQVLAEQAVLSGRYDPSLVLAADYSASAARSFFFNRWVVPSYTTKLLKQAQSAGFAAARVDVVAHSMGGLLTRCYLQSTWRQDGGYYLGDIHRLITIDSPHSGSQCANVLLDTAMRGHSLAVAALKYKQCDPELGGVSDLRVDGTTTTLALNGSSLNAAVVPTHAISCQGTFADQAETDHYTFLYALLARPQLMSEAALQNRVFGGDPNDLVVSVPSQSGGLVAPFTDVVQNQTHSTAPSNGQVFSEVLDLLSSSESSGNWWTGGFNPPRLTYHSPAVGSPAGPGPLTAATVDSVTITSPAPGTVVHPGDQVTVTATGTSGLSQILFAAAGAGGSLPCATFSGTSASWVLTIPSDAVASINLLAAGWSNNTAQPLVSSTVPLTVSNAPLDSIEIRPNALSVHVGDAFAVSTYGHFHDGVTRCLNGAPGLTVTSSDPTKVTVGAPDSVAARAQGSAMLIASYLGRSSVGSVDVTTPPVAAVPADPAPTKRRGVLSVTPNPSRAGVSIRFALPASASGVALTVFDLRGAIVRRIEMTAVGSPGVHELRWDGQTVSGHRARPGIYFARLRSPAGSLGSATIVLTQ